VVVVVVQVANQTLRAFQIDGLVVLEVSETREAERPLQQSAILNERGRREFYWPSLVAKAHLLVVMPRAAGPFPDWTRVSGVVD
jgi:hypothetical protein